MARRAAVQAAIDEQAEHFAQGGGFDLGFAYEFGAFVPDGSPAPSAGICDYRPDADPGSRLPHVAVRGDGFAGSTLGLVAPSGATLFATEPRWCEVAARAAADAGVAVQAYVLSRDFPEQHARMADLFGMAAGGTVAVRPDGCVLWRSPGWPDDALPQLCRALRVGHGLAVATAAIEAA